MRLLQLKGDMPRLKNRPLSPHGLVRNWQTTLSENRHRPQSLAQRTYNVEQMSPWIQCLCMRLLRFDFTVSHIPGKSLITTDKLFKAPVAQRDDQYCTEKEIDLYIQHVLASLPASNTQLEQIRENQEEDKVCQTLKQCCNKDWPDRTRVPDALKPHW